MVRPGSRLFVRLLFSYLLINLGQPLYSSAVTGFTLANVNWTMNTGSYGPFDSTTYTQTVPLTVNVNSGVTGNYFISFSNGGQTGYARLAANGASTQSYNLYKTNELANVLKASADFVTIDDAITGVVAIPNGGTYVHHFYFSIPKEQIIDSGSYSNVVAISLYEGDWNNLPSAVLVESKNITFTVPVAAYLALSINALDFDNSPPINTNIGTLAANSLANLTAYIQSNNGYRLKLKSANSGKMMTGLSNETPLPYKFTIDTVEISLATANAVEAITTTVATAINGKSYSGQFKVPNISSVFSGTYQDTITFTVEAY